MLRPVNITTNNVARELLRIAAQNSIPVSKLYININSVDTFIKDANTDFIEIPNYDLVNILPRNLFEITLLYLNKSMI